MADSNGLKPGYLTTEFYVTTIGSLIVFALGLLPGEWQELAIKVLGVAGPVIAYTVGRIQLKKQDLQSASMGAAWQPTQPNQPAQS